MSHDNQAALTPQQTADRALAEYQAAPDWIRRWAIPVIPWQELKLQDISGVLKLPISDSEKPR